MRRLAAWLATLLLLLTILGTASSTSLSPSEVEDLLARVRYNIEAAASRPLVKLETMKKHTFVRMEPQLHENIHSFPAVQSREHIEEDLAQVRPNEEALKSFAIDYYHAFLVSLGQHRDNPELRHFVNQAWSKVNDLLNDFAFSRLDYIQFSYILAREALRLKLIKSRLYHEVILAAARQAALDWSGSESKNAFIRTIPATKDAIRNPNYQHYKNFLSLVYRFGGEYSERIKAIRSDRPSLPAEFVHLKAHLGRYSSADEYIDAMRQELLRPNDQRVHDPYNLFEARDEDGHRLASKELKWNQAKVLFDEPAEVKATMEQRRLSNPVFPAVYQDAATSMHGSRRYASPRNERRLLLGRPQTAVEREKPDDPAPSVRSRRRAYTARSRAPTWSNQRRFPTEPANAVNPPQISASSGHESVPKPGKYRNDDLDIDLNAIPSEGSSFDMDVAPTYVREQEHGHGYPIAGSTFPPPDAARYDAPVHEASGSGSRRRRPSRRAIWDSSSNAGFIDGETRYASSSRPGGDHEEQPYSDAYATTPWFPPGYYDHRARRY